MSDPLTSSLLVGETARNPAWPAFLDRGKALLCQGDHDGAIIEFTQAIRLEPTDPEAYLLRGQASERHGEYDQAIADYTSALQIDVNLALAFAQRILAAASRRDLDSDVQNAGSFHPEQRLSRTYFLRGAAYCQLGQWARAVADFTQVLQLDPNNGLAFLRRGEANSRLGEWASAIADYTEALRRDTTNAETFNSRGELLQRQGQNEEAVADFTEALRLDPNFALARNNRGDAYLRRGQYEEAIADYSQAIAQVPRSVHSYLGRSLARAEKGDYERALADFTRALSFEPTNHLSHARQHEVAGQLRAVYDRIVADFNDFKRDFRNAISEFAATTPLPIRLAEFAPQTFSPLPHVAPQDNGHHPRLGHGPEAPDQTEQQHAERRRQQRVAEHYKRGQVFQEQGDYDRARDEYTLALRADAGFVPAYLERGLVCRLGGQFDEAVADFTTAVELDPGNAEAYLRRAISHTEQSEFDLAFRDYEEALRRAPDLATAYLNRALAYVATGDFSSAAEDAARTLEIDPDLAGAYFIRGVAHAREGRLDEAHADLAQVLHLEPEHARAYNQRGLVYAAQGRYAEAITQYTAALRFEPECDPARFNRGSAHRLRGDHDGAIADFTEFIRSRPEHAFAHYQRGLAYLGKKAYDEAIADFTRASNLDPNLHRAHESCLEATRAKYEEQIAQAAHDRPQTLPPHPTTQTATQPRFSEPTLVETAPDSASAGAAEQNPEPASTAKFDKLRLECPACGAAGLLDIRNLDKKFRCPGCSAWWRTSAGGVLVSADDPGIEVEVVSSTGRTKHRVPAGGQDQPGTDATAAPLTSERGANAVPLPAPVNPPQAPAPPKRPKSSTAQKSAASGRGRTGLLSFLGQWIAAAAATRTGRWALAGCVLAVLVTGGGLLIYLLPSELQKRGGKVAQAWLDKDVERLKQFVEPSQVENVPRWLQQNPPPKLPPAPAGEKPTMKVAIQHDDGKNAELLIQIKAKKKDGSATYFVFRQRWTKRGGTWYLKAVIAPTRAAVTPPDLSG